MKKEQRRFPRLPVDLPVILRHRGRLIPATALNISCGGLYLDTGTADVSIDAPVEIIFDLEGNRDLSLRGQITRVEGTTDRSGLGVQFTNVFSMSHKAVQDYCNARVH